MDNMASMDNYGREAGGKERFSITPAGWTFGGNLFRGYRFDQRPGFFCILWICWAECRVYIPWVLFPGVGFSSVEVYPAVGLCGELFVVGNDDEGQPLVFIEIP